MEKIALVVLIVLLISGVLTVINVVVRDKMPKSLFLCMLASYVVLILIVLKRAYEVYHV